LAQVVMFVQFAVLNFHFPICNKHNMRAKCAQTSNEDSIPYSLSPLPDIIQHSPNLKS
jgi:hypothetical protein